MSGLGHSVMEDKVTLLAFDKGFWGFNNEHPLNISYQAAFRDGQC